MIKKTELLARWKKISGDTSSSKWAEDHLAGFMSVFRPHGQGLAEALEGVIGADLVLPRLLEVYKATAIASEGDAYFIVRKPEPLSREVATEIATRQLECNRQMAEQLDDEELQDFFQPCHTMKVVKGSAPEAEMDDDFLIAQADLRSEFFETLSQKESELLWLDEAFYMMTADNGIRDYLLWPLYAADSQLSEPFEPYFQLWKHGAELRLTKPGNATVFVPELIE